jgi:hypothetical protein
MGGTGHCANEAEQRGEYPVVIEHEGDCWARVLPRRGRSQDVVEQLVREVISFELTEHEKRTNRLPTRPLSELPGRPSPRRLTERI